MDSRTNTNIVSKSRVVQPQVYLCCGLPVFFITILTLSFLLFRHLKVRAPGIIGQGCVDQKASTFQLQLQGATEETKSWMCTKVQRLALFFQGKLIGRWLFQDDDA